MFFYAYVPVSSGQVVKKLEESAIGFLSESSTCLRLEPATKADSVVDINKEAVIQD